MILKTNFIRGEANLYAFVPKLKYKITDVGETLYLFPQTKVELDIEDRKSLILSHNDRALNGETVRKLDRVRSLVVLGTVDLDGQTTAALLSAGVSVIYFSEGGKLLGRLEPAANLRSKQFQSQVNTILEQRLHISQRQIYAILKNYRRYLMRHARNYHVDLAQFIQNLEWNLEAIVRFPDSIAKMARCLGSGARSYYQGLNLCLQYPDFRSYKRRSDTNFNRMLQFVYELLSESVAMAIAVVGLTPSLGIWHRSRGRQLGLCSDFVAEFRHLADAVVVKLVNHSRISLKDFEGYYGEGLPHQVVGLLVREWQKKLQETITYPGTDTKLTYEAALLFQIQQLAAYLAGEIESYCPLILR